MTDGNKKNEEEKLDDAPSAAPLETPGNGTEPELLQLRQRLEAKEKEAKDNYERLLRQVAEAENLKKRVAREKEDALRFANEALVRDLLPVVDNLERAVSHAQGGGNGKPLVDGVEMVLKGLSDVLIKHGVVQILAIGQPFDPAKHEAMSQVETANQEPNTVVEEFHKGYLLRDRLLRPALVSVAKAPISKEKKNSDGEVENGHSDD